MTDTPGMVWGQNFSLKLNNEEIGIWRHRRPPLHFSFKNILDKYVLAPSTLLVLLSVTFGVEGFQT